MNTTILSFMLISIVIIASPGPSMFFALSNGLSGNKISGFSAVLSITLANVIWVALSATGLAALIHSSIIAFEVLRIFGAFYLIYLGIQLWKNGFKINSDNNQLANSLTVFLKGLATSLSNPKALIFYISFLPQFINDYEPFFDQIVVLGGSYIFIVFVVMSFYAFLGNKVVSIFKSKTITNVFGKTIATVYILSGLSLLKLKRA